MTRKLLSPVAAVQEVNRWFVYRPDDKDEHHILSPDSPQGDCEDYALTVLSLIVGFRPGVTKALRSGRAGLLFCRDPYGEKHNVLRYGVLYVDNQLKKWVGRHQLRTLGYVERFETDWRTVVRRLKRGMAKDELTRMAAWLPGDEP